MGHGAAAPPSIATADSGSAFAVRYPLFMRCALLLIWPLSFLSLFVAIRAVVRDWSVLGMDSHAYWLAAQGDQVYGRPPGTPDAYLYSPAFLALIEPLAMLPWPVFLGVWLSLEATVLVWLVKPLRKRWAVPIVLLCAPELVLGNIYILLAGAAVVGMRRPAAWAFPVLTKITTGVGLLWYAGRGDWRHLLQGAGGLAFVVGLSYLLEPKQWHAWIDFLLDNRSGTPDSSLVFVARCVLAAGLVMFGARRQQAWLIAPAMVLTSPVLVSVVALTILTAVPRLLMISDRNGPGGSAGIVMSRGGRPHPTDLPPRPARDNP